MRSLRTKLIAMLIGLMVLGMVPIFYDTYNNILSALMKERKEYLLQATTSEASKISDKLDSALNIIKSKAIDNIVVQYETNPIVNEELEDTLVKDFITTTGIANSSGVVVKSSDPAIVGKDFSNKPFVKRGLANESSVAQFIDFKNKKVHFYAFSPIQNTAGTITGVLFGEIEEVTLFKNMTDTTLHDIGDLVVTSKGGMVLHSTKDEDHFKSLWTLSDSEKKDVQERNNDKEASFDSMQYEEVKDKIENYSSPVVFNFFCKEDKEEEIMTVAQTGSYPLYLTTEFEKEMIQGSLIKNIISRILIACIIVGALVSIVGVLAINHLLKPLKSLKRAVEGIGRGNLDQKINIKTHDEFRELGNAIETMARDLNKDKIINATRSDLLNTNKETILEQTSKAEEPEPTTTKQRDNAGNNQSTSLDQVDDSSKD